MKPWFDSCHCNLMIAGPGIPKGAVCDKAVSLQDIYPTLLELLQVPPRARKIDGNSLVPLLKNPNAEYPTTKVGDVNDSRSFETTPLGQVKFDQPGLKLLRFISQVPKQRLRIDRIPGSKG